MRVTKSMMKRQVLAAAVLSAIAVAAMMAAAGRAGAADMPGSYYPDDRRVVISACGEPEEIIVLYDKYGHPTVPARTPYFYCVVGATLLPGEIPPPPEYCCH